MIEMRLVMRIVIWAICGLAFASCSRPTGSSPLPPSLSNSAFSSAGPNVDFTTLLSFDLSDGAKPFSGLIDVNGTLYGTTSQGGDGSACSSEGCGTVFKITTSGGEQVLHSFQAGADGVYPQAGLKDVKGVLYGTTSGGGGRFQACYNRGCGTVFKITTSGTETVVYSFKGGTDGVAPWAALTDVKGVLYGTTAGGGTGACIASGSGCGTVFKITIAGDKKILHNFKGPPHDGAQPLAGLTDVNGILYGTTIEGGNGCRSSFGCGTVFRITTSGEESVLYKFKDGTDGGYPQGNLINVNGTLYGTTRAGDSGAGCACGTVFKITKAGKETVVYSFRSAYKRDGSEPLAGLLDVNGTLYGTTFGGGKSNGTGTVFKVTKSGKETVLHSFNGFDDGGEPAASLIYVNGALYGTTSAYDNYTCVDFGCGTVFKVKL